jgi:hypothetical protein
MAYQQALSVLVSQTTSRAFVVVLGLSTLIVLLLTCFVRERVPKGLRLPPGPRGWPLVGSALQLGQYPKEILERWSKSYGEVFRIRMGFTPWVFLNSREAVKEVMEKQSAASSSRFPMPVANDICSGGLRVIQMEHNLRWRKARATMHKILTPKSTETLKPSQEFEAKQVLYDLLTDNKNFDEFYMHTRRYTTSLIMTFTYGKRIPKWVGVTPSFLVAALMLSRTANVFEKFTE